MQQRILLSNVDFGQPEAELDSNAIEFSYYEGDNWKKIISKSRLPFVIGRKGSGKSAIVARLEFEAKQGSSNSFLRIVPAGFRHVEIRSLLSCLVNKEASWQYIYSKVWEGIILGQLVVHLEAYEYYRHQFNSSEQLKLEIDKFKDKCGFYVGALDDALTDILVKYVSDVSRKTNEVGLVALRKMLEPYNWNSLIYEIRIALADAKTGSSHIIIAIDGLDEHWDNSDPSLFFLAQLLATTKRFTAEFSPSVNFIICLRDNIFRSLVDTKSIEYDKIESLIINLEWDSRSLFELVAKRVLPDHKEDKAIYALRELLPESIDGYSIDDYLGQHILNRPRDYINFFSMLQTECGSEPRAGEGHIRDTVSKYCANRLIDLENEFGFIYPGISKCIAAISNLNSVFTKDDLTHNLSSLCNNKTFRAEASELVAHYGDPLVLSRILLSIGVLGYYDSSQHTLRFVHEFSESRVAALWSSYDKFGIHPVYASKTSAEFTPADAYVTRKSSTPAIVTDSINYLPVKDDLSDLIPIEEKRKKTLEDLIADLSSIEKGQRHFHRWENWVQNTMRTCFSGDLINDDSQISTVGGEKKFEIIFDIAGNMPPWNEIKDKNKTHRALIECKNTDDPTDSDFSKLERDMNALDLQVAFMAYRSNKREPSGKFLQHQRSVYINSKKEHVIIGISEAFLLQCLNKKTVEKCRKNLNLLWRDHVTIWLIT